jgi:hypothetical protein
MSYELSGSHNPFAMLSLRSILSRQNKLLKPDKMLRKLSMANDFYHSPKPYFFNVCLATGLAMKAVNAAAVGLPLARFSTT